MGKNGEPSSLLRWYLWVNRGFVEAPIKLKMLKVRVCATYFMGLGAFCGGAEEWVWGFEGRNL